MKTVLWRLSTWDPDVASVRYRATIPARHLAKMGVASRFSASPTSLPDEPRPDAVVFVKAFSHHDVELARDAAREGIPVVLDVCDNVFAAGYRAHSAENLQLMAEVASAVVATGPALAEVLREELGTDVPVSVVPDPVETPEDAEEATRMLRREWLAVAVRERRAEIPRALAGATLRLLVPTLRQSAQRSETTSIPDVLWFGNVGSIEPRFGLVNLVDIVHELEAAAREVPFRLVVVTSDRHAYETMIRPLGLTTHFERWDRRAIFGRLRRSSVVVLPNSRDAFSICKSANRAELALSHGVPVVATRIPSLESLEEVVLFDDFRAGIVRYLSEPELVATHIRQAGGILEREYSAGVVAAAWLGVLKSASGAAAAMLERHP